nr:hypothetical protein [Methanosphaerula palustris]
MRENDRAGSVKKNVLPSPGVDSTRTLPPCRSTIFLTIARPIPVLAYSALGVEPLEHLEDPIKEFGGDPNPVIPHRKTPACPYPLGRDRYSGGTPGRQRLFVHRMATTGSVLAAGGRAGESGEESAGLWKERGGGLCEQGPGDSGPAVLGMCTWCFYFYVPGW